MIVNGKLGVVTSPPTPDSPHAFVRLSGFETGNAFHDLLLRKNNFTWSKTDTFCAAGEFEIYPGVMFVYAHSFTCDQAPNLNDLCAT